MMVQRAPVLAAALLAGCLMPSVLSAQVAPNPPPEEVRRPYRGLFGQQAQNGLGQSLNLAVSVSAAYDDDVFADDQVAVDAGVRNGGWYQGMQASLSYGRNTRRVVFDADAAVGVSRHSNPSKFLPVYQFGAGIGLPIARQTSLSASASLVYAPEFRLGLFVDPSNPNAFSDPFLNVAPDQGLFSQSSYRTGVGVSVTRALSRRENIAGSYGVSAAFYGGEGANYSSQNGALGYSRRLTQNASLRLGYGYAVGRYGGDTGLPRGGGVHNIDAGVDYGRALSISRRTHFSFSTGSALVVVNQGVPGRGGQLSYNLLGGASLDHEIGRTWRAQLAYRRSIDFHEGFADPFLSHSLSGSAGGLLSRRVSINSSVSLGRGVVGVGSSNGFDSLGATVGAQYALSRYLSTYASYVYYDFRFARQVAVDPRLPQSLARQGIRLGISTSVPLIRTEQR